MYSTHPPALTAGKPFPAGEWDDEAETKKLKLERGGAEDEDEDENEDEERRRGKARRIPRLLWRIIGRIERDDEEDE